MRPERYEWVVETVERDVTDLARSVMPFAPAAARPCPARALMLAVLEQALDDALDGRRFFESRRGRRRARHVASALAWFERTGCRWPFSFERVCEELDLDAGAIRRLVGTVVR